MITLIIPACFAVRRWLRRKKIRLYHTRECGMLCILWRLEIDCVCKWLYKTDRKSARVYAKPVIVLPSVTVAGRTRLSLVHSSQWLSFPPVACLGVGRTGVRCPPPSWSRGVQEDGVRSRTPGKPWWMMAPGERLLNYHYISFPVSFHGWKSKKFECECVACV